MAFDPEEDVAPGDTTSQDASKPGFQQAWSKWTSKPENNAALLQFGLAMLQPRAPGQSAIGQAANAVAEGGGAMGRVAASEKADELQAANIADKEAQRENQKTAAESGRITANAYDYGMRNKAEKAAPLVGQKRDLAIQKAFGTWLQKEDVGLDPTVKAVGAVDKAQIQNDPALKLKAYRKFRENFMMGDEGDTPDPALAGASAAPAAAPISARDKQGKIWTKDPASGLFKDSSGNVYKP